MKKKNKKLSITEQHLDKWENTTDNKTVKSVNIDGDISYRYKEHVDLKKEALINVDDVVESAKEKEKLEKESKKHKGLIAFFVIFGVLSLSAAVAAPFILLKKNNKTFNITLRQVSEDFGWKIESDVTKAKSDQEIVVKAIKQKYTINTPTYLIVKANNVEYRVEFEFKDDNYIAKFKMNYNCDIEVYLDTTVPIGPTELEQKCYTTLDGKIYVFDIDNLSSKTDKILLINVIDETDIKTFRRNADQEGSEPVFKDIEIKFGKSLPTIKTNFLFGCKEYNNAIDISQCTTLKSIPAGFLCGCEAYDQPITFSTIITSIGEGFMQGCKSFNKSIDIKNVKQIGDDFMNECSAFNSTLNLQQVEWIGDSFMYGCTSFNKNITVPSTVKTLFDNFMVNCDEMVSTITFDCPQSAIDPSVHSLGATNENAPCYKSGINIAGGIKEYIVNTAFKSGIYDIGGSHLYRTTKTN